MALHHHRAPRVRWGAKMKAACGETVGPAETVSRWTATTCAECLATHGIEPPADRVVGQPTAADLVRIGIVLQKAAGEEWPGSKAFTMAWAAWNVVTKIHGQRPK